MSIYDLSNKYYLSISPSHSDRHDVACRAVLLRTHYVDVLHIHVLHHYPECADMRVDLKHRVHIERTSACTAAAAPRRTVGYIHIEHFCAGIRHCSVRTYRLEPALPGAAYFGEVHHVQIFTRTPESIGCRRIAMVGLGQRSFNDMVHQDAMSQYLLKYPYAEGACFEYQNRIDESFNAFYAMRDGFDAVLCPNAFVAVADLARR